MASTLDPAGESPPVLRKGHGTAALGPSDSSDTGSDVVGGPGLEDGDNLPNRSGPAFGAGAVRTGAGADLGDANLDSDTDREGTGERAAVGHDATVPVDTILHDGSDRAIDTDELSDDDAPGAVVDTTRRDDNSSARRGR